MHWSHKQSRISLRVETPPFWCVCQSGCVVQQHSWTFLVYTNNLFRNVLESHSHSGRPTKMETFQFCFQPNSESLLRSAQQLASNNNNPINYSQEISVATVETGQRTLRHHHLERIFINSANRSNIYKIYSNHISHMLLMFRFTVNETFCIQVSISLRECFVCWKTVYSNVRKSNPPQNAIFLFRLETST